MQDSAQTSNLMPASSSLWSAPMCRPAAGPPPASVIALFMVVPPFNDAEAAKARPAADQCNRDRKVRYRLETSLAERRIILIKFSNRGHSAQSCLMAAPVRRRIMLILFGKSQ